MSKELRKSMKPSASMLSGGISLLLLLAVLLASPLTAKAGDDLARSRAQLRALYQELERFQDAPKFHRVGFGACCRYHDWLTQVEKLQEEFDASLLREFGFAPSDLRTLAMEYMRNAGELTDTGRMLRSRIEAGLRSPEPAPNEAVVRGVSTACTELDALKKLFEAEFAQNYEVADRYLAGPLCRELQYNTVVSALVREQSIELSDGSSTMAALVEVESGERLWLLESRLKSEK